MNKTINQLYVQYIVLFPSYSKYSPKSDQSDSPVGLDFNRQNINNYMYIMHAQGN